MNDFFGNPIGYQYPKPKEEPNDTVFPTAVDYEFPSVDYYPSERGGGKMYRRAAKEALISGQGVKPLRVVQPSESTLMDKSYIEKSRETKRQHHAKMLSAMRIRNADAIRKNMAEETNKSRQLQRMNERGNKIPYEWNLPIPLRLPFTEEQLSHHRQKSLQLSEKELDEEVDLASQSNEDRYYEERPDYLG